MRTLLFALGTLTLAGCGLHPVGPLAKQVPITQQSRPLVDVPNTPNNASGIPEIKPTPPTMYVTAEEVTPDNAHAVATKLAAELDTDMKTTVNGPVTVQVSRIPGGVRPR